MTTQRSGQTRQRPAPPRTAGDIPYTALRTRPKSPRNAFAARLSQFAHMLALVVGPIVLLSVVAAVIVYVRLLHGPVSLKMFSDHIAASINAELGGFTAAIDDAVITLAPDYTVEMQLVNLRLSQPDGDLVASAPTAAVELNKSALWRLEAAPERVFLIEPDIAVAYSDTQGFSLSIANTDAQSATPAEPQIVPPRPVPARPPGSAAEAVPPSFHRIDLARLLSEASARARQSGSGSSMIREIGVRNATVTINYKGDVSRIGVPEGSVDLAHMKRRSVISGAATIASDKGPWTIEFRADESDRKNILKVSTTLRNFVPSTLARSSPGFALLDMLDTPLNGDLAMDLSTEGDLKTASLSLDVGHGYIRLPATANTPMLLNGGSLKMTYDADGRRLTLSPSRLDWGDSHITLAGAVTSEAGGDGAHQWHFGVQSVDGALAAEDFGITAMPIESFAADGRIIPGEGLVQLANLSLKVGGGEVKANGELISGDTPSTRVEAALSPMPVATLKALWPRAAATGARGWVGSQVEKATIKSASLKLLSGRFLETAHNAEDGTAESANERLSASMEVVDLRMHPLPKSLPMEAPQATIRLENSTLEVTIPQAAIVSSETSRLPLKGCRFTVVDVSHDAPMAELALKSQAPLSALLDAVNHSELNLAGKGPLPIEGVDGKVDGEIKISMPLVDGASVVKSEGKARITDIKGRSKEHKIDLQGGTVDITVADGGVQAKGDLIVNGVVTKLQMQRLLDAAPEMQPPIRITAALDNSDRTQLNLDVNHLVQGTVPVEVTIASKTEGPAVVHARADLTNAELIFSDVAWRKPAGRAASLDFDIDTSDPARMALRNFRVVGDNIAIDGWMTIDDRREVEEFAFPNVSLNVVSRLDVAGKIDDKRIWKIRAKGTTFDAKDLFRSLLSLSGAETEIKPLNPAKGVDLTADIDTVIGHSDIAIRGYSVKLSERDDKLVAIDAQGTLAGGKSISVQLNPNGPRRLYADSTDAGQALKLAGFYPNMQGGRLKLEVDLEGQGAAEKSGVLWVDNFRVLGDSIVSEVYSSVDSSSTTEEPKKQRRGKPVEREVFEFQRLKAPFSIGHGQFVLEDTYIRGPLLGASIRGRVDFDARRLNLGGTYVPLQGINSALCEIPLFGPIVSGFDCQGVFGITYAIQGPMASPQVLVNPLSMFTPGILRTIMEMTSPNPQVQAPRTPQRRASGSQDAIDGWSSETTPAGGSKKKQ